MTAYCHIHNENNCRLCALQRLNESLDSSIEDVRQALNDLTLELQMRRVADAANETRLNRTWESLAACFGLLGAYTLAANFSGSEAGWYAFLVSNVAWLIWSIRKRAWWLVVQTLGFTGSSILGIWRTW